MKGGIVRQGGGYNKWVGRIYKNLHLREVLIIGKRGSGFQFFLIICIGSPAITLHRVKSKNADNIFEELSICIWKKRI